MKGARPWVAYVGPVAFPEGGAAARRILGNAKALVAAGYEVVIVSGQPPESNEDSFDVAPGIRCVRVNERDAEHLPNALRYTRYALMGARTRRWLSEQASLPAAVILYSGYLPYLLQLTGWARRRDVPFLFDAVEWYSAASVTGFLFSPYLWNTEIAMRMLIPRLDGVIAISRALKCYYAERGMHVGRVPPLIDPDEIVQASPAPDPQGRVRLAYCGSAGTKDLLDIVIDAVIARDGTGGRFVLDIAGPSEAEIRECAPVKARGGELPDCLRVHGQVSHTRSLEIIGNADFTVFLRSMNRVSTNGFPTKFVESLAVGTPIIANLTSDLADHLRDGETGLVCPTPARESLEVTLDRAFELGGKRCATLRDAARSEAERAFAYGGHTITLRDLIDQSCRKIR